jgi:hypothetical protein
MSDRKGRISSLKSTVNNNSGQRRVWDRRRVWRRRVDSWDPVHCQRNTSAITTEIFKDVWLTVTSIYRPRKQLKPRPNQFQAVHWLQRRCTAARIEYCHSFRRHVRHDIRMVDNLYLRYEVCFRFSGQINQIKGQNIWLWCAKSLTQCTTHSVLTEDSSVMCCWKSNWGTIAKCFTNSSTPCRVFACECSMFPSTLMLCNWSDSAA